MYTRNFMHISHVHIVMEMGKVSGDVNVLRLEVTRRMYRDRYTRSVELPRIQAYTGGQTGSTYCPCTYRKSLWIRASAK